MSEYSKQLRVEASRLGNLLSDKEKYTNRRRRTFRRRIHILCNAAGEIEELEATIEQAKSRCNVLIEEDARHLDDIIWIKEALEQKPKREDSEPVK